MPVAGGLNPSLDTYTWRLVHSGNQLYRALDLIPGNMPRKRQTPAQAPAAPIRAAEKAAEREVRRLAQGNRNKEKRAVQRAMLSECTRRYLFALADPFSEQSVGACIPSTPSFPSQKLTLFFRGAGSTGTNSVGWVWAAPFTAMANDAACVYFTDNTTGGAYTGTTFVATTTAGVDVTSGKTNSPYTQAQLASTTCQMRLVAAGLRLHYTGSELNKGGTIVGIEEPTHQSLNALSYANVRTYRDVVEFSYDGRFIGVTHTPIAATETAYTTFAARPSSGGYLGLMVKSAVASMPFAFELMTQFEAVGTLTAYSATANLVDPTGFAAAQQVIQSVDSSTGVVAEDGALAKVGRAFGTMAEEVLAGFSSVGGRAAHAAGGALAYSAASALSSRVRGAAPYRAAIGLY